MKVMLLIIAQLLVFQAKANVDVTCILEDCLREGWQTIDTRTGSSTLISCEGGDCELNGWHEEHRGSVITQTYCKTNGCFIDGWTVYRADNGRMIMDVTCQTSFASADCLEFGWVTYMPDRGSYITRCMNGDCRNIGWDVQFQGFAPQPVRCKRGGCFTTGWTVFN
ncbi:MAG: hypothetical protein A2Z20_05530 [Bdellovibrionales bacterium RBG_16_40_8]|nr:MAG: hypothetical protein A2Z20_05530 [Bdellovibrionales bacterium RBG_16_40_8]